MSLREARDQASAPKSTRADRPTGRSRATSANEHSESGAGKVRVDDLGVALDAPPSQLEAFARAAGSVHAALASDAVVQARSRSALDGTTARQAAARGVAGGATALPFAERIQRSFGRHAVRPIRAHVGQDAARASAELGALAYATGEDVVFGRAPDLFTTAHEAAHVVQQRGGVSLRDGVGQPGDLYEQHADEVAARVVRGESAETLLDRHAGAGRAGAAVQRRGIQLDEAPGGGEVVAEAGLGPEVIEELRRILKGTFPESSVELGDDGLPVLSIALGEFAWPMDGMPTFVLTGPGDMVAATRTVREHVFRWAGGEENFNQAWLILGWRGAHVSGDAIGDLPFDFGETMSMLGFQAFQAAELEERPDRNDANATMAYVKKVVEMANALATNFGDMATVLSAGVIELEDVYELRLPGPKSIYVKAGEEAPFIAERKAKLAEITQRFRSIHDQTDAEVHGQHNVDAEHSFAAWVSSMLSDGPELDMDVSIRALNAVAGLERKLAEIGEAGANDVLGLVQALFRGFEEAGSASEHLRQYVSLVNAWRAGKMAGAQEAVGYCRIVRDLSFTLVGMMAGGVLAPALRTFVGMSKMTATLVSTGTIELLKSGGTELSENGGDFSKVDYIKVSRDVVTSVAAKRVFMGVKAHPRVAAELARYGKIAEGGLDEALEGAIGDTLKMSLGQEISGDEFVTNVVKNLALGALAKGAETNLQRPDFVVKLEAEDARLDALGATSD